MATSPGGFNHPHVSGIAMFDVLKLNDGSQVRVDALRIAPTYAGQLEGSRESVSRHLLDQLRESSFDQSLQLIESTVPLAYFRCEVELVRGEVSRNRAVFEPRLTVVWFVENLADSFTALLEPVIRLAAFRQKAVARSLYIP
jgi:methylase of polypeptide subunit release factors